jgi:hypothetical protein
MTRLERQRGDCSHGQCLPLHGRSSPGLVVGATHGITSKLISHRTCGSLRAGLPEGWLCHIRWERHANQFKVSYKSDDGFVMKTQR